MANIPASIEKSVQRFLYTVRCRYRIQAAYLLLAAAFHMPEMATFLNRHFYGIFTPPLTILIIDVDGYAYLVPYVIDKNEYFLKTIIPSRKATKKYLGGEHG